MRSPCYPPICSRHNYKDLSDDIGLALYRCWMQLPRRLEPAVVRWEDFKWSFVVTSFNFLQYRETKPPGKLNFFKNRNFNHDQRFCFQSILWRKLFSKSFLLQEVFRQEDLDFISLLDEVRWGRASGSYSRTK